VIVRERARGRRLALSDDGLVIRSTALSACSVPKLLTPRSIDGIRPGAPRRRSYANAQSIEATKDQNSLAMKVLSMTDTRLQDRIDAQHLLRFTPSSTSPVSANTSLESRAVATLANKTSKRSLRRS